MNRFFVECRNITAYEIIIDAPDDVHHMKNVLRLRIGDEIRVSDSAEWEYTAELTSVSPREARGRIIDKNRFAGEPSLQLTLFQGIPKQGKMEVIIQKSVELGARAVVPVFTARSVPGKGGADGRTGRWQKVAAEAAKQCRRGLIPEVAGAVTFDDMLKTMPGRYDRVILPYEDERSRSIKDALRGFEAKPGSLAVIIGPEGGFAEEEAEALAGAGAVSVSLGKTVLRTETAGPAAIAMIMYELEL